MQHDDMEVASEGGNGMVMLVAWFSGAMQMKLHKASIRVKN